MKLLFVGGRGPLGQAACRHALDRGHEVIVAHRGTHELPADLGGVGHLHGERDDLLARGGAIERSRPDVLIDTRTKAANVEQLLSCARAAGARRLVVVSSTDVYEYFVTGSGYDLAAKSWVTSAGRAVLQTQTLPITEDAPRRSAPYPWGPPEHDNAAMERALEGARKNEAIALLRPGMIYGPGAAGREWTIVARVHAGIHRIELPDGGGQFFARAALDRVGRAVVAAAEQAPDGVWPVNVVDPYGWTYARLVKTIGEILNWTWEPVFVRWEEADPREALAETVRWLWDHGAEHYPDNAEQAVPTERGPEKSR